MPADVPWYSVQALCVLTCTQPLFHADVIMYLCIPTQQVSAFTQLSSHKYLHVLNHSFLKCLCASNHPLLMETYVLGHPFLRLSICNHSFNPSSVWSRLQRLVQCWWTLGWCPYLLLLQDNTPFLPPSVLHHSLRRAHLYLHDLLFYVSI